MQLVKDPHEMVALIGKISVYKHCFCHSNVYPAQEQETLCFLTSNEALVGTFNDNR